MNSFKEIGGYFGLDTNGCVKNDLDGILLASARNCLEYVIKVFDIKEIYIPFYTCPVVWQTIQKTGCKISFYHIDEFFMPTKEFEKDDFIVYTNYLGICAKNVKKMAQKYKNLIVDNAQAFYMPKFGIASFNSARKFFAVSDGAFLFCDKKLNDTFEQDTSYQRFSHLLKRADISGQFGYEDFVFNENSLDNQPLKTMSNLTKALLSGIDFEKAKNQRLKNFEFLHSKLLKTNELQIEEDADNVPLAYPYLIKNDSLRQKLIKNKIYVAQYWSSQKEGSVEDYFQKYLLPLPVDQRYSTEDMQNILEVLNA